jgi:hypothetical protein
MPNGLAPKAFSSAVKSQPSAEALRTVLNFQRVLAKTYFDAAGFPGRTVGLEVEGGKQNNGSGIGRRSDLVVDFRLMLRDMDSDRHIRGLPPLKGFG